MFDKSISKVENKEKVAIVVVGYNRVDSIKRLLSSLESASYQTKNIPLVISIDASGDELLYDYVRGYNWSYGDKFVNIQDKRLGLKKHIIQCGDLTKYFKAIILLEDDIFVSDCFYDYVLNAIEFYGKDDRIGGISLYQNEMGEPCVPRVFLNNGSDAYLKQSPASWGECWTDSQWRKFKEWYLLFDDSDFAKIDMPDYIVRWEKAWSKYFIAYLIETKRYFVFPYVSYTTCFSEPGEHSSIVSSIGQANLVNGKENYTFVPFEKMVKYDIYGVNEDIYDWVDIPQENLCVDWYGINGNKNKRRYILTPFKVSYPIVRSFALQMRPIELNIKYNIKGEGLYIYDTKNGEANVVGKPFPLSMAHFFLRGFYFKLDSKYVISQFFEIIKKRIHFWK